MAGIRVSRAMPSTSTTRRFTGIFAWGACGLDALASVDVTGAA
jgi:hypothetical protein